MPESAQLVGMIGGGAYEARGTSPDAADAMVSPPRELMLKERRVPRVRGFGGLALPPLAFGEKEGKSTVEVIFLLDEQNWVRFNACVIRRAAI